MYTQVKFWPGCHTDDESMLHLSTCEHIRRDYWNHFLRPIKDMGFPDPENTTNLLTVGAINDEKTANEEVIGILTIAWRCLYAEITASRLNNKRLKLVSARKRAWCMIHGRLNAYGEACRTFCIERRFSGRKCKLPKKLSKRKIIQVQQNGTYTINTVITETTRLLRGKSRS